MIRAVTPLPIDIAPARPVDLGISDEAADVVAALLLSIADAQAADDGADIRPTAPT